MKTTHTHTHTQERPKDNWNLYLRNTFFLDAFLSRCSAYLGIDMYLFLITGIAVAINEFRNSLRSKRYYTSRILSIWKIILFLAFIMASLHMQGDNPLSFFSLVGEAFNDRTYKVDEVRSKI